jgi:hypothetical protein
MTAGAWKNAFAEWWAWYRKILLLALCVQVQTKGNKDSAQADHQDAAH